MIRAAAVALLASAALPAHAAILTVDCAAGPFFTIGAAVAAAANGDTIVVHACPAPYNENVVIAGFDQLHLVGAHAPADVGAWANGVGQLWSPPVIVDGAGLAGACIAVRNSIGTSITGFRLRRCFNGVEVADSDFTSTHGNRIEQMRFAGYMEYNSRNSVVTSNLIGASEYGVYLEGTSLIRLHDNRVGLNRQNGIFLAGFRIDVVDNEVTQNTREGIYSVFGAEHRLERNRVIGNGGVANLTIGPGVPLVDAVGNQTAGSLVDMSASDLGDNL